MILVLFLGVQRSRHLPLTHWALGWLRASFRFGNCVESADLINRKPIQVRIVLQEEYNMALVLGIQGSPAT